VPDVAAAAKAARFVVAVVDTGVDAAHPDLEVTEFVDYVDTAGKQFYKKDGEWLLQPRRLCGYTAQCHRL
jgi:hypothetical protein